MQHCDKGLQKLDGKVWSRTLSTGLRRKFLRWLSTPTTSSQYARLGYAVYPDGSFSDPNLNTVTRAHCRLRSGIMNCKTPYLLTVPCDSPFLPLNLAERLFAGLRHHEADIAIACTANIPIHARNLCFVYSNQLCLNNSNITWPVWQKNGRLVWQLTVARVYFQDETEFLNINTWKIKGLFDGEIISQLNPSA